MLKAITFFVSLLVFVIPGISQDNSAGLMDSVRTKAEKIHAEADQLKPKADELQNLFAGYKSKAKGCPKALKEASDGFSMAKKAVKDIEEAQKLTTKALKSKKPEEGLKQIKMAEQKVHQAKYFVRESDDRKKETEFELRGCK